MPVLHVGDIEIVAQTQQLTSPSIHIKKSDGEMYYVALSPLGGGIFDGSETLVYSETSINKCHSVNLEPGIYRVEMRGGTGGKPYRCTSGSGMTNAMGDIVSSIFKRQQSIRFVVVTATTAQPSEHTKFLVGAHLVWTVSWLLATEQYVPQAVSVQGV